MERLQSARSTYREIKSIVAAQMPFRTRIGRHLLASHTQAKNASKRLPSKHGKLVVVLLHRQRLRVCSRCTGSGHKGKHLKTTGQCQHPILIERGYAMSCSHHHRQHCQSARPHLDFLKSLTFTLPQYENRGKAHLLLQTGLVAVKYVPSLRQWQLFPSVVDNCIIVPAHVPCPPACVQLTVALQV